MGSYLGLHLWSGQRRIVESVRDHRKTSVRSGHGIGKTTVAAATLLWFLYCFPESRVITTATKWSQVKHLLWHEVDRLWTPVLGGEKLQTELHLPDGRYALGLSTKPEQLESFQGHHAPNILLIYDEASGVPTPVYEAGEGYMTTEGAHQLLIGNPLHNAGEFYDSHHSKRTEYETIALSVFDSPNFTGEPVPDKLRRSLTSTAWVDERRSWQGTMLWDVRVMGEFSRKADDAVIPLGSIEEAMEREVEVPPDAEKVIGCDVARFGSDETTIYYREGRRIELRESYVGKDTMVTAGHLKRLRDQTGARVVVDDAGVGGGVTDRLREQGIDVTAFVGSETALAEDDYPNRRSELWFVGAENIESCSIPNNDQLAADLVAPVYKLDSQGRRVVEPKDKTKKRLGRSPDHGDGMLLTFAAQRAPLMEVW